MEQIRKSWTTLSCLGVTPEMSSIDRSKIVMSNRIVSTTLVIDAVSIITLLLFTSFPLVELVSILIVSCIKIVYFVLRSKFYNQLAPLLLFFVFTLITFFLSLQTNTPPNIEALYIIGIFYLLIVFTDLWRCFIATCWVVSLFILSKFIQFNYMSIDGQTVMFTDMEIRAGMVFISTILFSVLIIHWYLREVNKIQAKSNQYLDESNQYLEEIKLQNTSLAKINDEMKQFSYIASHDLKTPLRSVVSFLGIIERKLNQKKYEDVGEYLGFAKDGATQMYQLINDILEYSRLSSKESSKSQVNLNEIFNNVKQQMNLVSNHYQILKTNDLPVLFANKAKMNALFQNLIENGLKYNDKEKPKIEINSNETNENLVLEFKDNGIGIDPAYKNKVFEMFKRLHNKDKYNGTGIGLAICKKIVESMNGKIEISTDVKEGSLFIIKIPKLQNLSPV